MHRVCVCVCVRTSIYGVTPAEGYLLFNLFVGGSFPAALLL